MEDPNKPEKIILDIDDLPEVDTNRYGQSTRVPKQNNYNKQPQYSQNREPVAAPDYRNRGYNEQYCTGCGQVINVQAEICPKCGIRQKTAPGSSGKNRITAALLAFFLGGVGIHKFYLGQTGMGIVYLLFCWTFIPGIIAFVEAIIYLTMSDEKFENQYGVNSMSRR